MAAMKLLEWRPLTKNSLRGFVSIELPNGLIIKDISVLTSRNGPWCSLPAKPAFGPDGKPRLGQNGRPLYTSILEWRDRELQGRWSETLLELLLAQHPNALDEGGLL